MPPSATTFPCCRDHGLFTPVEEYPQCIQRTPGEEAYWFDWDSSFDGKATIRIAKLRDDVMVSRVYRTSRFGKVRRFRALLTPADWSLLEDAIVAANFWMLDERGGRHGLDGSTWRFAGRRRRDYHYISRWSPDDALWDLGRFFFDVAGLAEVRLRPTVRPVHPARRAGAHPFRQRPGVRCKSGAGVDRHRVCQKSVRVDVLI
jgi:hypothetical protein